MDGDGEGNIPVMEKERVGNAAISVLASDTVLSVEGDTKFWNPTGVVGLFWLKAGGSSSSMVSSEDLGVIDVASRRVGSSLMLGTMLRGDSFRFITPVAVRFLEEPSRTGCSGLDLKKGCHVRINSSEGALFSWRSSKGSDRRNEDW